MVPGLHKHYPHKGLRMQSPRQFRRNQIKFEECPVETGATSTTTLVKNKKIELMDRVIHQAIPIA